MIKLTKLDGKAFFINPIMIETIESTPDTVITLSGGKKFLVQEAAEKVIEDIGKYRQNFNLR